MNERSVSDIEYMQLAIRLAERGLYTTDPNPRVGCVLVKDGQIIGEGWHQRAGEPHAEIVALAQAGNHATGSTVYVTLEPCSHTGKTPPCADALIDAGVSKVVVAMVDPNPLVAGNGLRRLNENGITTESGLLENQAKALNPGFIKRMEKNLPYVRVKMAMSLDGRTAMASGESQWITGQAARRDVQFLRARSSVILTGIDTVLSDNPSMNVRLSAEELGISGDVRQPMRVVLDSQLRFPPGANICKQDSNVLVVTSSESTNDVADCMVEIVPASGGHVDLKAVMKLLADKEVNEVHVEAGPKLCGALIDNKLVDELIIYMAPHLMGDEAKGLFTMPGLSNMKHRVSLDIHDIRSIGKDLRITAKINQAPT